MKEIKTNARDWQTRIRLWASWILAVFALANMIYYSAGLISSEAMESVADVMQAIWLLSPLFGVAILTHMSLGMWKLFNRNTLRMPFWEAAQIILGMTLPLFQFPYLVTTDGLSIFFGYPLGYVDRVLSTFPRMAWDLVAVLLIMGAHAQIGMHVVLRMRAWYPRVRLIFAIVATALPLTAALGYLSGGNALYQSYTNGTMPADDKPHLVSSAEREFIDDATVVSIGFFLGVYAVTLGGRAIRLNRVRSRLYVTVSYPSGQSVKVFPGTSVLEASRIGKVPHASICGGRGRCTTCRVKVESGAENLSALGEREFKALQRIQAPDQVRLACQARCTGGTVQVTPLLPPNVVSRDARRETVDSIGRDVELAVMFVDLRGFTSLSENKFPYDTVFILNRYFEDMGKIIEDNGGVIDKFLGDGILAYFGHKTGAKEGCLSALNAALAMSAKLGDTNAKLKNVLGEALSIGIGIHVGDVVLGQIGYREKTSLTIIGDAVNVASRLQGLNKAAKSQLILSTKVAAYAGIDLTYLPVAKVTPRGKTESLRVFVVKDISRQLSALVGA